MLKSNRWPETLDSNVLVRNRGLSEYLWKGNKRDKVFTVTFHGSNHDKRRWSVCHSCTGMRNLISICFPEPDPNVRCGCNPAQGEGWVREKGSGGWKWRVGERSSSWERESDGGTPGRKKRKIMVARGNARGFPEGIDILY